MNIFVLEDDFLHITKESIIIRYLNPFNINHYSLLQLYAIQYIQLTIQ